MTKSNGRLDFDDKYGPNLKNFLTLDLEVFSKIVRKYVPSEYTRETNYDYAEYLAGAGKRPKARILPNLTVEEKYTAKVFQAFSEFYQAFEENLEHEHYFRQIKMHPKGTRLEVHARIMTSSYFQSTYILKERLLNFVNVVFGRRATGEEQVVKAEICLSINLSFKEIVNTRNLHTHASSYDDQNLSRVVLIGLLRIAEESGVDPGPGPLLWLHRNALKKMRTEWVNTITSNNANLLSLLENISLKLAGHLRRKLGL